MSASSQQQPQKSDIATPTLNHLLRMPTPPRIAAPGGLLPYQTVPNQIQTYSDGRLTDFSQIQRPIAPDFRQFTNMPPGYHPAMPGMLPPQRAPSSHVAMSPIQKPVPSPAPTSKESEIVVQPLLNGSAGVGQSPKPQSEHGSGTHPSVAALRQEGPSRSPSRTSTVGSPSAPARHSPVSPAPVSIYGNLAQPTVNHVQQQEPSRMAQPQSGVSANTTSVQSTTASIQNPMLNGTSNQNYPNSFPYGIVLYPDNSQGPQYGNFGTVSQQQQQPPPQQPYFGHPPVGYSGIRPTQPQPYPAVSYASVQAHQTVPYVSTQPQNFPNQNNLPPPQQQPIRPPHQLFANGPSAAESPAPIQATPSKPKSAAMNNEVASLPSTPGTQSPGNASTAEDQVPDASPSWPRTPLSPAVSGQRTPLASSTPMGPPPNQYPTVSASKSGGGAKEVVSMVEKLTGSPFNMPPDVYGQRRNFYEALVQFSENRSHPITTQPTVSKQPVDLFRLYHAVKERGGFEVVTKGRGWRGLCPSANLNADSSSAGYQLRKHYIRYLLPCECAWDRGGKDPRELIEMVERQKKPKKKKIKQQQPEQTTDSLYLSFSYGPNPANNGQHSPAGQQQTQPPGSETASTFPSGSSFPTMPYSQVDSNGTPIAHPAGTQWPHPQAVNMNSGYPGVGHPQFGQQIMPPQQGPPQSQPHFPPPVRINSPQLSTAGNQIGSGSSGVPLPQVSGGEMIARDPFDDRSGTPQNSQAAHPNVYYQVQSVNNQLVRTATPVAVTSSYQQRPYTLVQQPPPPVSVYPPSSIGQQSIANQPPVSLPISYQLVPSTGGTISNESGLIASAPAPPRQHSTLPSSAYVTPVPSYSQVPTSVPASSHTGYMGPGQPMYRGPHPYYPTASTGNAQPLPPSTQYAPVVSESSQSHSAATPPYVHPAAAGPPTSTPTTAPTPAPGPLPFPPTQQYVPWQPRYNPPSHQQPPPLPPSTPAVYTGVRPVIREKSPYYHQFPSSSVYQGGMGVRDKPAPNSQFVGQLHRRDSGMVFPPGCVEATQPTLRKRRKKLSRDIGKVEAWRLMMALKSGLMSESHWALNVLNILLYDDSSALYFGIRSLPGLLEVLVEHLRRSLMEIFPDEGFKVLEEYCSPFSVGNSGGLDSVLLQEQPVIMDDKYSWNSVESIVTDRSEEDLSSVTNFNRVTRTGRPVQIRFPQSSESWDLCVKSGIEEDCWERNCVMNRSHWKEGGGLSTDHLKLKRFSAVEESESLQFAKRQRSDNPIRHDENTKEKETKEEDWEAGAPIKFFYRKKLKSDKDSIGCEVKTVRVSPLTDKSDYRKNLVGKCLAVSNILRGLVLVPGNEVEMSKHAGLVFLLGRLLLIRHNHLSSNDSKWGKGRGIGGNKEEDIWVWECGNALREDAFVIICQLSAQLDLSSHEESVCRPLLLALIHWVVCGSAEAQDPLPPGVLSPLRYSLEALCKLSVLERNVDLILATPPWPKIERMLEVLGGLLNLGEEPPCREFALVLVNAMCGGSEAASATAALATPAIHHLVSFLEQADANMHQVVQTHGMQQLRENPELMGTSVGMLRRAASVLQCLSRVASCRFRFLRHHQRLLQFTMSQLMDSRVAAIIADTLFELQKPSGEMFRIKDMENDLEN